MRSTSDMRPRRAAWSRYTACALCTAWIVLAGCASTRRALPAPRVRDEAALQAEAGAAPQAAEPYYQMALLRASEGNADGALDALRRALHRDPGYAPALALFAKMMHDAGRGADALQWFEGRDVGTLPEPVRVNVAVLYAEAGNTLQARKLLDGAAHGPWADAANANLAYVDLLDEQSDAAWQRLQTDLGPYAQSPEVLNNVALARVRAGDVDGGAAILRKLADSHPDFAAAQLNWALVLRNYYFDEDGAARAQAHLDAIPAPHLGDAAVRDFFEPVHEDAAPPVPSAPQPQAAAESPPQGGRP